MADKGSLLKRGALAVFSEAGWQAFWTYVFPPLSGFAAAWLGITEHQPLMWVLTAGATSFAMISLGLLAFGQWRFKRTAEHKIQFSGIKVDRGNLKEKAIIVLGFRMKSTADFPIEVTLKRISSSIATRCLVPAFDGVDRA
jgi:hypothetical protein